MKTLLTIFHRNGVSKGFPLNLEDSLSTVRELLSDHQLMEVSDCFFFKGSPLEKDQENEILLSQVISDTTLVIGSENSGSHLRVEDGVDIYKALSRVQKQEVLDNLEICKGLIPDVGHGFRHSTRPVITFSESYLPVADNPMVNTETSFTTYLSKTAQELSVLGISTIQADIDAKVVSNEAEFKQESTQVEKSSEIMSYFTARYVIRKSTLHLDCDKIQVNRDFVEAVRAALKGNSRTVTGCYNLMKVLNEWGYYIPLSFSLGGVLYSKEEHHTATFSRMVEETEKFKESFKCSYKEVSGGVGMENSTTKETTDESSVETGRTLIQQIGGLEGLSISKEMYPRWVDSLKNANYWRISDIEVLYPTLLLLNKEYGGLLGMAVSTLDRMSSEESIRKQQPLLDLKSYTKRLLVALRS